MIACIVRHWNRRLRASDDLDRGTGSGRFEEGSTVIQGTNKIYTARKYADSRLGYSSYRIRRHDHQGVGAQVGSSLQETLEGSVFRVRRA